MKRLTKLIKQIKATAKTQHKLISLYELAEKLALFGGAARKENKDLEKVLTRFRRLQSGENDSEHVLVESIRDILRLYARLTENCPSHWLDPAYINLYLSSYIWHYNHSIYLGLTATELRIQSFEYILRDISLGIAHHINSDPINPLYSELPTWCFPRKESSELVAIVHHYIASLFEIETESDNELINRLYQEKSHDEKRNLIDQYKAWIDGTNTTDFLKLRTSIIDRLSWNVLLPRIEMSRTEIIEHIDEVCIACHFGAQVFQWFAEDDTDGMWETLLATMELFIPIALEEEYDFSYFHTPLTRDLDPESYAASTLETCLNILREEGHDTAQVEADYQRFYELAASIEDIVFDHQIPLPTSLSESLVDLSQNLTGFAGITASAILQALQISTFQWRQSDLYYKIHEKQYARDIYKYNSQPIKQLHADQEKYTGSDFEKPNVWAASGYKSGRIDEYRQIDRYRRTRLMWACELADVRLINRLLQDGADPWLPSIPRGKSDGDNCTSILLLLQNKHRTLFKEERGSDEMKYLIIRMIETNSINCSEALNIKQKYSGKTVLSCAIETAQPEIVEHILAKGADPNHLMDSDKVSALYFCLQIYFTFAILNQYGPSGRELYIYQNTTSSEFGIKYLNIAKRTDLEDRISFEDLEMYRANDQDVDSYSEVLERLGQIMRQVLKHGADVETPELLGYYPLDMAIEIINVCDDPLPYNLLTEFGAHRHILLLPE
jgi:ankyrin repeat protein